MGGQGGRIYAKLRNWIRFDVNVFIFQAIQRNIGVGIAILMFNAVIANYTNTMRKLAELDEDITKMGPTRNRNIYNKHVEIHRRTTKCK